MNVAPLRRAFNISIFLILSCLISPCNLFSQTDDEKRMAGEEARRDTSPGATLQDKGFNLLLESLEEGSKLTGRMTLEIDKLHSIFEIEASATLQKGKDEVELLNIDGLGSGDTSVKAKWAYVKARGLKKKSDAHNPYRAVCNDVSTELVSELFPASTSRNQQLVPIKKNECTEENLKNQSGKWLENAEKAVKEAVQEGCNELFKINPENFLAPVDLVDTGSYSGDTYGKCTEEKLKAEVKKELAELIDIARIEFRIEEKKKILNQLSPADTEKTGVIHAEILALENLEKLPDIIKMERQIKDEIKKKKTALIQLLPADIQSADGVQAEITALERLLDTLLKERRKLVPDILLDIDSWLEERKSEKLQKICKEYNWPEIDVIRTKGFNQNCDSVRAMKALESVTDESARAKLRRKLVNTLPVLYWSLTLSGAASNQDFTYVDPELIGDIETYDEFDAVQKKESELNTSIGLTWSTLIRGHAFSIGYERREIFIGGDTTEICTPIGTGAATRCTETTVGVPFSFKKNLGLIEWRRFISANVALKLRAYYIDEDYRKKTYLDDEFEVQALFYFLRSTKEGLNGGFDFAYDTAFHDLRAKVFIGKSFKLFG